jgi:hypothetical protein
MFLEVQVKNTSGGTLSNLLATINAFSNSSFTLDSGESSSRLIGTLANGATASLYWFINYPCNLPTIDTTTYTVTASDSNPGTVTSSSFTLSTRSELSANAGGNIDNSTIGAGAIAGQTLTVTINYAFGNPAAGADAMIQPAGNVSFDSAVIAFIDAAILDFHGGPGDRRKQSAVSPA